MVINGRPLDDGVADPEPEGSPSGAGSMVISDKPPDSGLSDPDWRTAFLDCLLHGKLPTDNDQA